MVFARTPCRVAVLCLVPAAGMAQSNPTFARDVAPVVFQHCTPCHREGAVAPFSLASYEEVRSRARLIARTTAQRYMPPWKPEAGKGGPFAGERRLTDAQIDTIARWVDAGAPEGDPRDLPPLPPAATGWRLGTPDLVVTLPAAYRLAADGPDMFRTFTVPLPIGGSKYVAGVEFRPGGPAIHHASLRLDPTSASRELDAADPQPGYEGGVSATARYPEGSFLGWTPGQVTPLAPKGLAWRLTPGTDLVVQLHLKRTGRAEAVQPTIGFYFTNDPPEGRSLALRLGEQDIDIAAGTQYVVRDSYRLPVDVEVHAIHPHAHYRATTIEAFAELPDGTRRWLLRIGDWDFNWEDVYRYASPVPLPRGTTLRMQFTYDNSAQNPRNPDRPPRRVIFGQSSSDEMGDLWLQVLTRTPGDRAILFNDIRPKTMREEALGYRMLLTADPDNARYHTDLGLIYGWLGRFYEAVAEFETAIRLNPSAASSYYNLATLLAGAGQLEDAAGHFRKALELRPDHAQTHNNLGVVLRSLGRHVAAVEHLRRAVALDPGNEEAKLNLAMAEASTR